jgi:hypothetical protein
MANRLEQVKKTCEYEKCDRAATEEDRCYWHLKEIEKTPLDSESDVSKVPRNLRGAYLRGADLSSADLRDADLSGADLLGALLSQADLTDVHLSGANLRGTGFVSASTDDQALQEKIATIAAQLTKSDENERARAIDAIAILSTERPELCTLFFQPLLQSLNDLAAPSVQVSAVRALTTSALETGAGISEEDATFAEFIRDGSEFVREETAGAIAPVVTDRAENFPETLDAFREALTDDSAEVRLFAATTLSIVSYDEDDIGHDAESLLTELDTLSQHPHIPDTAIDQLTEIVRQTTGFRGGA